MPTKDLPASVTIAANSSLVIPYLTHTVETAWLKYQSKAYLHWYQKYGCSQVGLYRYIIICLLKLDQILKVSTIIYHQVLNTTE